MLAELDLDDHEIVSLYYGSDVTPDQATEIAALITNLGPDLEVELLAAVNPITITFSALNNRRHPSPALQPCQTRDDRPGAAAPLR